MRAAAITLWKEIADREFLRFARVAPQRLTWMTVIGAALVVKPGVHAAAVHDAIAELERKFRLRCRRKLPGIRARGIHEIDVLTSNGCKLAPHKSETVEALGVRIEDVSDDERIMLIHLHCVIDRGPHSEEMVTHQLRAEFQGVRRVMGKPLSDERSVSENLRRLAGYSTKLKAAYCDSWGGRVTKFGTAYEPQWKTSIELTIRHLGLRNLLFIHGGVSKAIPAHHQLLGENFEDFCGCPAHEQPLESDQIADDVPIPTAITTVITTAITTAISTSKKRDLSILSGIFSQSAPSGCHRTVRSTVQCSLNRKGTDRPP